ncbi:MAG: GGDEF domain-containing protein [Woeseiaceae bacterium]
MEKKLRLRISIILSLLLIPVFLFFDLYFPLGVAGGVPYVALVLVGLITQRPNTVIILAAVATLLTIVGYFISPVGGLLQVVLINRGLALFAIWSVAIVSFVHLKELARLEPLATRDQLTNLFNRHYFTSEIVHQINFWRRHQQPLSILLIDVDHFKKVNDTYGHIAGDYALKTIADICLQQVRDVDTIARVGGEEFAVLLPSTAINGAMQMAERIRIAVQEYKFKYEDLEFNITMSIGVTEIKDESWSITEFMKAVDKMLYEAKRTGRNRCVAHHISEST